jgi:hypothetical protein
MRPVEPYQGDRFDGSWAAEWVDADGKERLQAFAHLIRDRLLPAIGDPAADAEKASQDYWNERMSEPVGEDDDVDPGSIAEEANDKGIAMYQLLFPLRQSALNLGTAGLFHLFEQTCTSLGTAWIRDECRSMEQFVEWVEENLGINVKSKLFWKNIKELNSLANVIKHGEGGSADKLRRTNPKLFHFPGTYQFSKMLSPLPVVAPLAGSEIFVTLDDFDRYLKSLEEFWECLRTGLNGNRWNLPKPVPESIWQKVIRTIFKLFRSN